MPSRRTSPQAWLHRYAAALLTLMAIAVPATLLAVAVYARAPMLQLATNSDGLLAADMVWEWLNRPEAWRSFQWPRIPSLVPDMLVFAALQAGFGWRIAQLGYSALSLATLAGLAGCIAAQLRPISVRCGALVFLAVTSAVLLLEWALAVTPWHLHLLAAAYHSGPFILSIAALALARRGGAVCLGLMLLAAAAGTFSDKMVIGTFLLPLMVALAVQARAGDIPRAAAIRLALLAAAGCALGLAADKAVFPALLTRQADVPLGHESLLWQGLGFLLLRSGWFVILLNASLLAPLLRPAWRRRMPAGARFWWLVGAAAALPSSLLGAGLWFDDGAQRYIGAALWWPLILWSPWIAQRLGRHATVIGLSGALAASAAFAASLATAAPPRHPLLAWQDDTQACVAATGRTVGLADYWPARQMTVSSDWHMLVMQVGARGNTRPWGSDPSWYTTSRDRPGQLPAFSFIVMKSLDPAAIRSAYGPPDRVLPCPHAEVWLYDDPARMRAGLAAASPSLVPRGQKICVGHDRLSRHGGFLPAGPLRIGDDRRTSRPVTWGPNLDLHPGRWRVTLRYRLQTDHPGEDRWLVNGQWGSVHFASTTLAPSGGEIATSAADVTLDREFEAVEVPTYLAGKATLEVVEACFTPVE